MRATAAGAFNRKREIATPTQRSFARAASYEDELAQRIAELASYKFNPTPPRGGGGGGKTAVNLGENLGGSGNLSGGGLTPQTAQSVKAALNAQTPQPQPTLSPNLQKPNLTPQTAEVVTPTTVKAAEAVAPLGREVAAAKTARYVDEFAKTSDFKALSSDKQEAILSLKEIKLNPMPEGLVKSVDSKNIITHFSKKLDGEARKFYYKLFDEAKTKPDIVLLNKNGKTEYIKAYEHTAQKDMYYLAFTQDGDGVKVTGIPTTQIRKVVEDIAQSEKVAKAEDLEGILELRQADKIQSPQLASEIATKSEGQSQVAELEDDLMKRFEVFEKQAQNDKVDVDSWFEAQRKQGNKDVLEYDKDLEIYREANAKMQSQTRKQAKEASFKEQGLQWLKQNKSFFENKTDEELIALFKQNPEIKNAHEELDFIRKRLQKALNIQPLKEFGTNYAEFYRDGAGAVKKLMAEKQGQVAGAFYREELGDITLAWGEAGTGKSDGWGLAKIVKYHPEVLDNLSELVEKSPIVKESDNRYLLDTPTHFLAIRKEFDGQKENWLLTAFEKDESIARRRTDLPSSQSEVEKAASTNTHSNSSKISQLSQAVELKTAIKEALKGPKKAPAVKHEGLKELEAVLKERLKEASGDVSFQRAQAREWRQTLESAQEAQKSSERLDHLKFRLAERIGDFRHAQRVRTDYEAKLRELGGVESSFKELSKKLSQLSKNPKPQDLSELYATKEGLLRVEGLLRGVEVRGNAAFNKLRSEVTQALEKSFDAINAAKKGLTPKAVEAAAPTRTQEFLDFTQDAKERVEWALGVSAEAAEKTIDELVKKSGGESARLKFLERLRASVKALGQESSEVVTPKTTEAVTPNLQKANLIKERLKNYKKD